MWKTRTIGLAWTLISENSFDQNQGILFQLSYLTSSSFRLKYLQLVELVHGGRYMEDKNFSAPTDTFMEDLKQSTPLYLYHDENIFLSWLYQFNVPLAAIITKFGYCISFNMMTHENLFNHEKLETFFKQTSGWLTAVSLFSVSSDFHYQYLPRVNLENYFFNSSPENMNESEFPIRPLNNKMMLSIEISDRYMSNEAMTYSGSQMIVHNVDEYPSDESSSFTFIDQTLTTLAFDPVVFESDESLRSTTLEEY
jgi:hypothetical protein